MAADISFDFQAAFGRLESRLSDAERWRQKCAGALQRVPIVSAQVSGDGVIDAADALGAKSGYFWSIRRLTCTGFTAGLVTVFRNINGGEPLAPFPEPGVFTFGRGEMLLSPMDRLVIAGTDITGTFQVWGEADCFEAWYLPFYIG